MANNSKCQSKCKSKCQKLNRRFTGYFPRFLFITFTLFTINPFYWILPSLAQTTVGNRIDNTATGSFEIPDKPNFQSFTSNLVTSEQAPLPPGSCTLGGGTPDSAINAYISDEVKRNNSASRGITDNLDNAWSAEVGIPANATIQPWFGKASSLGNVNSFRYFDRATSTNTNATVELVEIPINNIADCQGLSNK